MIGTESEDRLDKKICPWDAIKMYEFEEGQEISEYFYDITKIKEVNGVYVVETEEKERWKKNRPNFTSNPGNGERFKHGGKNRNHGNRAA